MKWCDIGSGVFAKTFKSASYLPMTDKGGPYASDVYRRIVRSLSTGKVIDDCIVDNTDDQMLKRKLPRPDNL